MTTKTQKEQPSAPCEVAPDTHSTSILRDKPLTQLPGFQVQPGLLLAIRRVLEKAIAL